MPYSSTRYPFYPCFNSRHRYIIRFPINPCLLKFLGDFSFSFICILSTCIIDPKNQSSQHSNFYTTCWVIHSFHFITPNVLFCSYPQKIQPLYEAFYQLLKLGLQQFYQFETKQLFFSTFLGSLLLNNSKFWLSSPRSNEFFSLLRKFFG